MYTALMEDCMVSTDTHWLLLESGAQVNMPADSFASLLTLAACWGHVLCQHQRSDRIDPGDGHNWCWLQEPILDGAVHFLKIKGVPDSWKMDMREIFTSSCIEEDTEGKESEEEKDVLRVVTPLWCPTSSTTPTTSCQSPRQTYLSSHTPPMTPLAEPDRVPSNITTPPLVNTKGQSNRSNFVNSLTKKTTRHQLTAQGINALQVMITVYCMVQPCS
ncbi:unnamed protein product [Coregonus sp. 'balchen']|nr:unnamed protein product [Coregonus sp. 'balchen']